MSGWQGTREHDTTTFKSDDSIQCIFSQRTARLHNHAVLQDFMPDFAKDFCEFVYWARFPDAIPFYLELIRWLKQHILTDQPSHLCCAWPRTSQQRAMAQSATTLSAAIIASLREPLATTWSTRPLHMRRLVYAMMTLLMGRQRP